MTSGDGRTRAAEGKREGLGGHGLGGHGAVSVSASEAVRGSVRGSVRDSVGDSAADSGESLLWLAMARGPVRFPLSRWPWRSLGYLLTSAVLGLGWLTVAVPLVTFGVLLVPVGFGVPMLLAVPLSASGLAAVERRRLRWIDPRPAPGPNLSVAAAEGWGPRWLRTAWLWAKSPSSWLEFGFALVNSLFAVVDAAAVLLALLPLLGLPFFFMVEVNDLVVIHPPGRMLLPWLLLTPVYAGFAAYLLGGVAGARATLARALLVRARREEQLGTAWSK